MRLNLPPDAADWFTSNQSLPPSYSGNSLVYALSVFGMMTVFLLACEWLWRVAWSFRERPKEIRHPVTVSRCILTCLLLGIIMRVSGDVFLTATWPEFSPQQRLWVSQADKLMDGLSAIPMLMAWLWGVLGGAMVDWQLARLPIPINLWPSWKHLGRPLLIGVMVLFISFAVTYLR